MMEGHSRFQTPTRVEKFFHAQTNACGFRINLLNFWNDWNGADSVCLVGGFGL